MSLRGAPHPRGPRFGHPLVIVIRIPTEAFRPDCALFPCSERGQPLGPEDHEPGREVGVGRTLGSFIRCFRKSPEVWGGARRTEAWPDRARTPPFIVLAVVGAPLIA